MINIESAASLAKHAINCIIIAITKHYQIAVNKAFYLITPNTKDFFSFS